MKKVLLSIFLVMAFCASAMAMTFDEAKTQNKTMVIMFKMRGCSACRQFEPIFDKAQSKYSNKFNFLKEDYNTSKISNKFKFSFVPSIFMYNPKTEKSVKVSDDDMWSQGSFDKFLNNYSN